MKGPRTMLEKIWDAHVVTEGPGGQTLLFIDMRRPDLAVATADHYLPTTPPAAGVPDPEVRGMLASLARHVASPGATITVDLEPQTVTASDGSTHPFEIDPFRKQALLTGQDEIALTLTHEAAIAAFESRRRAAAPWLFT